MRMEPCLRVQNPMAVRAQHYALRYLALHPCDGPPRSDRVADRELLVLTRMVEIQRRRVVEAAFRAPHRRLVRRQPRTKRLPPPCVYNPHAGDVRRLVLGVPTLPVRACLHLVPLRHSAIVTTNAP